MEEEEEEAAGPWRGAGPLAWPSLSAQPAGSFPQEQDRQILLGLMEEEDKTQRLQSARREQAVAAVAWMKGVIEEQLQLEREREAELETIFR